MDELIYFGAEVKALGDGRVGGYLIRFSDPSTPDLTGDYFDATSTIETPDTMPVFYQHGFDKTLGKRVIGKGTARKDEVGVWLEAQLNLRDEYEKTIYQMAVDGKLGYSSGALGHMVEREQVGKSYHIKTWIVGEASLTPTPAEPRNGVLPIKSLFPPVEAVSEQGETNQPSQEKNIMDEKDILAIVEKAVNGAVTQTAEAMVKTTNATIESRLNEFKASLPEVKSGFHLEVVEDEADKAARENPFKSFGDFGMAVKNAELQPYNIDKRLLPYKAPLGANEAIPSQGGFLVPQQIAAGVFERMYKTGSLLGMVTRDPVQGNNLRINAVDETSRATGSRYGGLQGYWLEEAGSITATKPKFAAIDLKLKKVAALAYATDEVLEDVGFMSSWLNRTVPEELRFLTEDAVYNGDGAGKPLGFMNSPAVVSVTRLDANEINYQDIVNMWARRWAGVNDYVWLVNQDAMPQLDSLVLGDGATGIIPPRFVDYGADGIMRIKGRPVMEVEYAASLGTAGDIVLFSPSQYQLIDKAAGIQSAASIHVAFTTAEQAFRFIYRVDGAPLWKSALTPFKGSNTQTPYVALSASS